MRSRIQFDVATCLALLFALFVSGATLASADDEQTKKSSSADGEKKNVDKKDGDKKDGDKKDGDKKDGDKKDDHTKGGAEAKGGGGHGHDASDLGHGFAGEALETPHEVRTDLAIYSFIVFALLLLILKTFAWGPIVDGLQKREDSIASTIARAEQNAAAAEARAKEYETKLTEAAEEARAVVAQARADAEATAERIQSEADEARKRDRDRFLADIEGAKNAAISEVAQRGADIAIALAGQIVRREIKAGDHAQLIQESLDRFPSNN